MIRTSQQHLAIIDYPEGRLQQVRWSVTAFSSLGFEVILRQAARFYRPARERPYLGLEFRVSDIVNRKPDWFWMVPAGCLPTVGLIGQIEEATTTDRIALSVTRGKLRPGLDFRHAGSSVDAEIGFHGWAGAGAGVTPEDLVAPAAMPHDRGRSSRHGLVDPFIREPWQRTDGPVRWDLRSAVWESGRQVLGLWRRGSHGAAVRKGLSALPSVVATRREDCALLAPITAAGEYSVTYVLDRLVIAGGVLSVIQLVNELILLGIDARIACLFEDPAIYRWQPLLTRPMVFRSARELVAALPRTDLAVATLWKTAPWVVDLKCQGRARSTAYFLQDYEPWFFPERQLKQRQRVTATYASIPHRIVKSDWLAGKLQEHGCGTTKIPLGLNLDVFYPRPVSPGDPTLLAMARPGTGHRGFPVLAETLRILADRHPRLNIELFGSRTLPEQGLGHRCRNHAIVEDPAYLAELYRRADIFVDTSHFQGFGRCGLEAMACGTACVLTATGGVGEYAADNVNAMTVQSGKAVDIAACIDRLLADPSRRAALTAEGLKTAAKFDLLLEAARTRNHFRLILALATEPKP